MLFIFFQNKRKGRRLIRPRIEPSGASTSSMEAGEGLQDGAGEIVDTDGEAVSEGKAPVTSEHPDSSGPPSTGVAEAVPAAVTTALTESVMVLSLPTAVSFARKRTAPALEIALSDDDHVLQESKSEKAPPLKKSRPAEVRFFALQYARCVESLS